MDIGGLRLILAVNDEATLTAAAQRLGISRQAVGKALQSLEREFGSRLFERRAGRYYATAAGAAAVDDARGVVATFDEFCREHVGGGSKRRPGEQSVSVALVTGGSEGLPKGFFERFATARNRVHLEVDEMSSDAVLATVGRGASDVGVVGSHPDLLEGFETCTIMLVGTWLLIPEGHPLWERSIIGLRDLDGCALVTAGRHNHLHRFVMQRCERAGVVPDVRATAAEGAMMLKIARDLGALCFGFPPEVAPVPPGMRRARFDIEGGELIGTYAIRRHGPHGEAANRFWRYVQAYEG